MEGFFYKNGVDTELVSLYDSGRLVLNTWLFSKSKVELYNAMDGDSLLYSISFDRAGKINNQSGLVFSRNLKFNFPKNIIPLNKVVELKIPIVIIPNYSIVMEVVKINNEGKVIELDNNLPIENYYAVYRTKFTELGNQSIGIAGALIDDNNKVIKRDTLTTTITVIR